MDGWMDGWVDIAEISVVSWFDRFKFQFRRVKVKLVLSATP